MLTVLIQFGIIKRGISFCHCLYLLMLLFHSRGWMLIDLGLVDCLEGCWVVGLHWDPFLISSQCIIGR